jgi:exonuclease III
MSQTTLETEGHSMRGVGGKPALRILQYNVNKSRNKVLAALLEDQRLKTYDVIAVQEPWRNPFDSQAYNPRDSGFHLIDLKRADSRVSIYINKDISENIWTETVHSPDLLTVSLRCTGEQHMVINIHNIYNPPPPSHSEEHEKGTLPYLQNALRMPGAHIVVGDFNLHHPLWCAPEYGHQHNLAEDVLINMRDADLELALPPGTITREAQRGEAREETTIDLVWMSSQLLERLVQCRVAREIEQSSDHLPIATWVEIGGAIETQANRERRAWKKIDWRKFDKTLGEGLKTLEQDQIDTKDQISRSVVRLTQAINMAIASSTPWIRTTGFSKTWWTQECRQAVDDARKARRIYTRNQTIEAWEEYVRIKTTRER